MKASKIHFSETNSFSSLILDYLDQDQKLSSFIAYPPTSEGIHQAAKKRTFRHEERELLVNRLQAQYAAAGIKIQSKVTEEQILSLKDPNTFTITTGHQLGLLGGPLYFVYKIASIISLSRKLKKQYSDYHFVPVFWMASEDHDFEEINHFYFKSEKYQWNKDTKGQVVGSLNTEGLKEVFEPFFQSMEAYSTHAANLRKLIESSYLTHDNYAHASRQLVHHLFAEEGLLIIDGDDKELKRSFIPEMREELTSFSTEKNVLDQSEKLGKHYKIQVNPRQINLFYLEGAEGRERIEKTNNGYALVESEQKFTDEELAAELEEHPDRFSPNVLMRPMYQEKILPNLAYIGGGGELAYWFQLKQNFEQFGIDFPVLVLRNSCLYVNEKQSQQTKDLGLSWQDLFEREGDLIKQWVVDQDNQTLLLEKEKADFERLWKDLKKKSLDEDPSLARFVEAKEAYLQQWLDRLGDKLIRSQRRKSEVNVDRIKKLKAELFPGGSLQERRESFVELYLIYGEEMVPKLIEAFEIPTTDFLVLEV